MSAQLKREFLATVSRLEWMGIVLAAAATMASVGSISWPTCNDSPIETSEQVAIAITVSTSCMVDCDVAAIRPQMQQAIAQVRQIAGAEVVVDESCVVDGELKLQRKVAARQIIAASRLWLGTPTSPISGKLDQATLFATAVSTRQWPHRYHVAQGERKPTPIAAKQPVCFQPQCGHGTNIVQALLTSSNKYLITIE